MNALITKTRRAVRKFHNDEAGMETLQTVAIIAVAALVLVMLSDFIGKSSDTGSSTIGGWVADKLQDIFDFNFSNS